MSTATPSTPPPFRAIADLVREHARQRPRATALADDQDTLSWAQLDAAMDRVAASLQRDGLSPGDVVALCAAPSVRYAVLYLGALRAGMVVAPLAPSVTPDQLIAMLGDAEARRFFVDAMALALLPVPSPWPLVSLDGQETPGQTWSDWLAPNGQPQPFVGTPEAAVQHHLFVGHHRHAQRHRAAARHALGPRGARHGARLRPGAWRC